MGAAERATRRKVLDTARKAVEATNETVERYNGVVQAVRELGEQVEGFEKRLTNVGDAFEARLAEELRAFRVRVDGVSKALQNEIQETAGEFAQMNGATMLASEPLRRGFFGRLNWLVTGR